MEKSESSEKLTEIVDLIWAIRKKKYKKNWCEIKLSPTLFKES